MVGVRLGKAQAREEIIGELRRVREEAGLTIKDVSEQLNIPVHQIEALEEGDVSVFSAVVYAQGAYTKYAEFLGIHSVSFQKAVWRVLSSAKETVPLTLHTPQTLFERLQGPRVLIVAAIACAVLMVGGYIAWQVRAYWRLPKLEVVEPVHAMLESPHVRVRGVADSDVELYVNGTHVVLREDHTFEVDLLAREGVNNVVIEAKNAAGRVNRYQRQLLLPRNK